jgi:hypothetical protein
MNWIFLIFGILALALGLHQHLLVLGVPLGIMNLLSSVPTFGLNQWIIVGVGVVLVYFGLRR